MLAALSLVSVALVAGSTLGRWYPAKSSALFAGICLVSAAYFSTHRVERIGPANLVTLGRAALVALIAALVGEPASVPLAWLAAILAGICAALDGLDGWLARRTGLASAFGARFDMEVDALLIMSLAIIAWWWDKAGMWILLAGGMRYLFVLAGYLWNWLNAALPVSTRRKAVCVVQMVGLAAVVSPLLAGVVSVAVALGTLTALTWSFGVDVLWLRRHAA
jgi:phosphatidylglycerophosphate synthase